MKKLVLLLVLLLGVETYGVYGAAQTSRIVYTCTMPVGPLCYVWNESALSKIVGLDRASELESKLANAREEFEKGFVEKVLREAKGGKDDLIEEVQERAAEVINEAKETAKEALDSLKKD